MTTNNCESCNAALDSNDVCTECGIHHGDPCPCCDRRGIHTDECPENEENANDVMTPAQKRVALNELLDCFQRSWGGTKTTHANQVLAALKNDPWLKDQVPYDILGIIRDTSRDQQ
jgi:hypothetical protein